MGKIQFFKKINMKHLKFTLLFVIITKLGFCQIYSSNVENALKEEISQIKNSQSLIKFLINHSAKYQDFDSIYSKLDGINCPENLTYNLINGDSNKTVTVNKAFLYLIGRNFLRQSFNNDFDKIKSLNDIVKTFDEKLNEPYTIWLNSYIKISDKIKNNILFNFDSVEIKSAKLNIKNNQKLKLKSNMKSWILSFNNREKNLFEFKENAETKKGLKIYKICHSGKWENNFWNQVNNQDKEFLKNDMGGSIIAKTISDYISAQVFDDLIFFQVDGRIVWIDVSP
jgi:hypothetical protein